MYIILGCLLKEGGSADEGEAGNRPQHRGSGSGGH